jgi:1,4-dihydroxy-2-naphthoate octaprenyltransferase
MQYGLGIAIASAQGVAISLTQAVVGQFLVSAIQLMVQYANEYFDMDSDLLNAHGRTLFSGGSGVLPSGRIKPKVAFFAARVCAAVAIFLTAFTVLRNPLVSAIATLAILGGWFYSAPPLSLMGSGWGELSASIIVALLVPSVGYIFQTQRLDPFILLVCLPLMLIHWAMIIAFELPDLVADTAVGKRTQTVRLGLHGAFILHTLLLLGALISFLILTMTVTTYARYLWLAIPLIIWQGYFYAVSSKEQSNKRRSNLLTIGAVGLFSLTTALWLVGFVTADIRWSALFIA